MIIREPTVEEIRAFYGDRGTDILKLKCAEVDGQVVAMCGMIIDPMWDGSIFEAEAPRIGFLELAPGAAPLGWAAVVAIRQHLREMNEPIVVQLDHELPKAERLLTVLGFTPTQQMRTDFRNPARKLRIWKWQPSVQSPPS